MKEVKFNEYSVVIENGKQFLLYKGEKLPHQINTCVYQDVDMGNSGNGGLCQITITVFAKLKDTIK